jgi:DNA-binding PadR family transcriptional regulator
LLKYMILGTLMERPYHGYQLKTSIFKRVAVDFGVNDGQLYPTLKTLEKSGYIHKTIEHQEGAPSRHVYSITTPGKEVFLQWLTSDEGENRLYRYDFVRKDSFFIRCSFIQYLSKEIAIKKVEEQIAKVEKIIADFKLARDSMITKGVSPLRISLLEYGLRNQEMRSAWLRDYLITIEENLSDNESNL